MVGRRTSLASLAGQKVDDVPGKSDPLLLSLPLDKLVPTRFNPRRRFGTDDELREFGQKLAKEQLQPAVVVSRTAYLKLWPEEAEHVGTASYVIANGERRYRASKLVDRPVLEVVHKEDVAASRASFLDAVQSENNDRENLDPIERALGIDIMVTQLGGADQVAVYYGKTKGWVSQQRKLLRLTPELQDLVSGGEMPIRVARDIAGLPPEVQGAAWEEELERRRLEKQAAARLRAQTADMPAPNPAPQPASGAPRFTAVNPGTPEPAAPTVSSSGQPERFTAVNQPAAETVPEPVQVPDSERTETEVHVPEQSPEPARQESVPEPRPADDPSGERKPVMFPYDDGAFAAQLLIHRMPAEEFDKMADLVVAHRAQQRSNAD